MTDKGEFIIESLYDFKQVSDKVHQYFQMEDKKEGETKPLEIKVKVKGKERSRKQDKYYFGVLVADVLLWIAEHPEKYLIDYVKDQIIPTSPEEVHIYLKNKFNDGKSITKNDVADMEAYHLKIREFYHHEHNLTILEPNEGEEQ